jgi:hypothetical protein
MNSQQLSKLTVLPLNKTVVFYSPIEGRDVLVRTGTLSEGNSFVHAIFHAYSKDYVQMEKKGRMKLVSKLYSKISDKFLVKRWEDASTSVVTQVPFQENISELLADFYRFIAKEKDCKTKNGKKMIKTLLRDKKDLETYQIICEIISEDDIEKKLLPAAYEKCTDQTIEKCRELIRDTFKSFVDSALNKLGKGLEKSKRQFLTDKTIALCDAITEHAEQSAYKKFSKSLKDVSITVDPFTIGILAEKFNRDIYFIDSRTRMPYLFGNKENIKGRKSIVVMWVGGIHYEIVGKLLPGNRIQRQFEKDDPLVKRINTFLYRPENVAEQYPNLIHYLSKDDRTKIGFDSRSESARSPRGKYSSTSKSRSESAEEKSQEKAESSTPESRGKKPLKKSSSESTEEESDSRSGSSSGEESDSSSTEDTPRNRHEQINPHHRESKRRSRHRN